MANGIVHFEIPADDPEQLIGFYTRLFDWRIEPMGGGEMEYWGVTTTDSDQEGRPTQPGAINGGLTRRTMPQQTPITFVAVDSVDEYVTKATALGATVAVGSSPVPGMGYFAVLVDPQHNAFGIWQEDMSA